MASPPFHLMGIAGQLVIPLYAGTRILLWDLTPPADSVPVPTPENTIQTLKAFGCDATTAVPSFLVNWAQNEEAVQYLRQMDHVVRCLLFLFAESLCLTPF